MVAERKPITDKLLAKWLEEEFKNKRTKMTYLSALRRFKKINKIENLKDYLKQKPNIISDLKNFLKSIENKPSKTISTYVGAVKVFLRDNNAEISDKQWRKLKKRGFMPKRIKAETQDKKPTKPQLKRILNHMNIKGRAMVLFLISSGARIGETLQLKVEDFDLNSEPPKVHIKARYTKGKVGERTVYFSFETRDILKDWISIKNSTTKRPGLNEPGKSGPKMKKDFGTNGTFEDDRMFPWNIHTAHYMWNSACDKAGLGLKDKRTGRRVFHLHSLRKFFRSNIGLDLDYIHALMGHVEYLDDAYLRLGDQEELAKAYLSAMKNVSVYSVSVSRKEEVKRILAINGLTCDDILQVLGKEMYKEGFGSGGGYTLKVSLDEDYIASLEDQEIGKYALQALREKLLGHSKNEPKQKVIDENSLESYLSKGWKYVNSLNNGSQKCIIKR